MDEIFTHRFTRDNGDSFRALLNEKPVNKHWWTNVMHTLRNIFTDAAKRNGVDLGKLKGLDPEAYMNGIAEQMVLGKTLNEYTAYGKDKAYFAKGVEIGGGDGTRNAIANVYTGSAADYEKPSLLKVGTGEGSQVYGWGLYGSSVRGVADEYAYNGRNIVTFKGERPFFMSDHDTVARFIKDSGGLENARRLAKNALSEDLLKLLNEEEWSDPAKTKKVVYEQTFFTNRAHGDESHLLNWYGPSENAVEQIGWIRNQAKKEGFLHRENIYGNTLAQALDTAENTFIGRKGEDIYKVIEGLLGSPKAASEFLARANIDGIKYPVNSYGGKGVKDGDIVGWNYVSFRDDNISIDHKWVDGEKRYSRGGNDFPNASEKKRIIEFDTRNPSMFGAKRLWITRRDFAKIQHQKPSELLGRNRYEDERDLFPGYIHHFDDKTGTVSTDVYACEYQGDEMFMPYAKTTINGTNENDIMSVYEKIRDMPTDGLRGEEHSVGDRSGDMGISKGQRRETIGNGKLREVETVIESREHDGENDSPIDRITSSRELDVDSADVDEDGIRYARRSDAKPYDERTDDGRKYNEKYEGVETDVFGGGDERMDALAREHNRFQLLRLRDD